MTGHKILTQEEYIPYNILSVILFSINYRPNKTHKSRLKYETKYDLYKISPKNKQPENPKFCTAEVFRVFTSRCYAERGYETVCLSVCICLSVCDVQDHIVNASKIISCPNSLRQRLYLLTLTHVRYMVQREHPKNCGGIGHYRGGVRRAKTCNISETVLNMTKVTMTD